MRIAKLVGYLCVPVAIILGQEPPNTMTRIEVRLQSPQVPEQSFAAKPKVMYRAGSGYCRIEEQPDPDQGIHGLMIINEPDVWMLNLYTNTARHFVDSGPTFNCRLPVFNDVKSAADLVKNPLLELEFGKELEYFRRKGAVAAKGPVLRQKATTAYNVDLGDSQLFLFTVDAPERPWAIVRQHAADREIFWYGGYEQLPFDPKLFAKPAGAKMEEVK